MDPQRCNRLLCLLLSSKGLQQRKQVRVFVSEILCSGHNKDHFHVKMTLPPVGAVASRQDITVSVKVASVGVNLPVGQRKRQINKLLIGKWLIAGMIIGPIEQVAM